VVGAAWEAQYLALQAFLRENDGRYPADNAAQTNPSERSLHHVRPVPPCRVFPSLLFYFGVLGLVGKLHWFSGVFRAGYERF